MTKEENDKKLAETLKNIQELIDKTRVEHNDTENMPKEKIEEQKTKKYIRPAK